MSAFLQGQLDYIYLLYGLAFVALAYACLVLRQQRAERTARRRLRESTERLAASERQYRSMFEDNGAVMLLIDATTAEIVDANAAACAFYGYSRAELLARKITDINTLPVAEAHRALAAAHRGECKHYVFRHRLASGEVRDVEVRCMPMPFYGRECIYSIIYDVTERARAEEQLRSHAAALHAANLELEAQRQQLQAQQDTLRRTNAQLADVSQAAATANAELAEINQALELAIGRANQMAAAAEVASIAKSEFLANMSHEIRTPMTAILGYIELITEGCIEGCDFGRTQLKEFAGTLARNAHHLLQILNDILDLSKIEAGKLAIEQLSCAPVQMLADIESLMSARAAEKKLSLTVECLGPLPQTIRTDPTRLRQILLNLVGNALKFTDSGGVRVTARLAAAQADNGLLQFDVVDTGIGMLAEHLAGLFQPFSQVDTSTVRRFGGTGLGLSISKRLAEMLGGTIAVQSAPGKGSTFTVTVATGPLKNIRMIDGEQREVVTATGAAQPASVAVKLHGRILLAEDGPDNQKLISFILRKAGAEVTLAENGQVAVECALAARATGTPFDLIFMDMQMPIMDGYTAARRLREENYSGPIIALTAHAMASDRDKCVSAGCDDYATKPIDRAAFLALTARYLERPVAVAQSAAGATF